MAYRGWIDGRKIITSNLDDLSGCESVEEWIGLWVVLR